MRANRTLFLIVGALGVTAALVASGYLVARGDVEAANGDVIAYSCKEPKNLWFGVCTKGLDGTPARRLTTKLATSDPAWSPDGRRIAFTRHEDVGEYTAFSEDDVLVMDRDGGHQRQVTAEVAAQSSWHPAWSPDGEQIAFLRNTAFASSVTTRFGDLFVAPVAGGTARRLTSDGLAIAPDWSPDGRLIALAIAERSDGVPTIVDTDIYVVDATGGQPHRLTRTPNTFETAPAWSPDGSRIAFARWTPQTQFDGKGAIYVMDRDGSGERLVLSHRHFSSGPYRLSWSPDGRTIAFETSPTRECTAISLLDVDSGSVRPLTACSKARESAVAPTWQPAPRMTD
jgi:Tol biopolymer transport system component